MSSGDKKTGPMDYGRPCPVCGEEDFKCLATHLSNKCEGDIIEEDDPAW